MEDEPADSFADETGHAGPWHQILRDGELLWLSLVEQKDIANSIVALKAMSEHDLSLLANQ